MVEALRALKQSMFALDAEIEGAVEGLSEALAASRAALAADGPFSGGADASTAADFPSDPNAARSVDGDTESRTETEAGAAGPIRVMRRRLAEIDEEAALAVADLVDSLRQADGSNQHRATKRRADEACCTTRVLDMLDAHAPHHSPRATRRRESARRAES
jgi:hypothetical protein